MNNYKLASHNSWSYLPPRKWWMYPLRFTAKCQSKDIKQQYEMGVRCFDLRVRFHSEEFVLVHGLMEYKTSKDDFIKDLFWLDEKGDVSIRVVLDIRRKNRTLQGQKYSFQLFCKSLESWYKNIKFFNGQCLYDKETIHKFGNYPSCEERYASVCKPKLLDDWFPWMYAKLNNKKLKQMGTEKEYLMLDFVNIG